MEIEIHAFVVTIKKITPEELKMLVKDYLHLDFTEFTESGRNNYFNWKYSFGKNKESVDIRGPIDEEGNLNYLKLNLHGSFFDNSPDFRLDELLNIMTKYGYTLKQLDVAFTDDKKYLSSNKMARWCNDYKTYCKGSLVKIIAPGIRYANNEFDRIELGSAKSLTCYGTIYVRPDTGYVRIEIKVKSEDKIKYLLDKYSMDNIHDFEQKSIQLLVGCIDFYTATSKKNRASAKHVRQQSWQNFLETNIKKVNWDEKKREMKATRILSEGITCERQIKNCAAMLQNLVGRLSNKMSPEEIIWQIDLQTGNILSKCFI